MGWASRYLLAGEVDRAALSQAAEAALPGQPDGARFELSPDGGPRAIYLRLPGRPPGEIQVEQTNPVTAPSLLEPTRRVPGNRLAATATDVWYAGAGELHRVGRPLDEPGLALPGRCRVLGLEGGPYEIWVGASDGAIHRYRDGRWTTPSGGIASDPVYSFALVSEDEVWAKTGQGQVLVFEGDGFRPLYRLPGTSRLKAGAGKVCCGGTNRLYFLDRRAPLMAAAFSSGGEGARLPPAPVHPTADGVFIAAPKRVMLHHGTTWYDVGPDYPEPLGVRWNEIYRCGRQTVLTVDGRLFSSDGKGWTAHPAPLDDDIYGDEDEDREQWAKNRQPTELLAAVRTPNGELWFATENDRVLPFHPGQARDHLHLRSTRSGNHEIWREVSCFAEAIARRLGGYLYRDF